MKASLLTKTLILGTFDKVIHFFGGTMLTHYKCSWLFTLAISLLVSSTLKSTDRAWTVNLNFMGTNITQTTPSRVAHFRTLLALRSIQENDLNMLRSLLLLSVEDLEAFDPNRPLCGSMMFDIVVTWAIDEDLNLFGEIKANLQLLSLKMVSLLQIAALLGRTDAVKMLIDFGAEVNAIDFDQTTPLDLAAFMLHFDTSRLLLLNGGRCNKTLTWRREDQWITLLTFIRAVTSPSMGTIDRMETLLKQGFDERSIEYFPTSNPNQRLHARELGGGDKAVCELLLKQLTKTTDQNSEHPESRKRPLEDDEDGDGERAKKPRREEASIEANNDSSGGLC